MKLLTRTTTASAVPRTARWLAAGLLTACFVIPTQALAQTGCNGAGAIISDGVDSNGNTIPDYVYGDLPEAIQWTLIPASGTDLDITVSEIKFGLSCFDNGDLVPCTNGNDGQEGTPSLTPIQYTQVGAPGGTCGATLSSNENGVVTFALPEATLDKDGCSIIFDTELQDRGIDSTPNFITTAAAFNGVCALPGGGSLQGGAQGSSIIEIINPAIEVTKTGPENAKVGDSFDYTISFTVLSDAGALGECTLSDPVLDIVDDVVVPDTPYTYPYTVEADGPNPIENTATVTCAVNGSASTVFDDDTWDVNVIDPEIDVTKTGPSVAKVGDEITYTIGFTALSDGDALGECTGSDTVLGDLGVFVSGQTRDFLYTVQGSDDDPLPNTATITCAVEGFDNTASDSAEHSVDLIDPEIDVTKTGPSVAKVGDEITYTIGFTALSDGDALGECTGSDTVLGDLGVFVSGQTRDFLYTVQPGDSDPLPNTATITCAVEGFDNTASDSADHSVDLIGPEIDVTKTGPGTAKVGDEITYTIGFTALSDGDALGECTGSDTVLGDLGVFVDGVTRDFQYTVQEGDDDPLPNTATITCAVEGFDNTASDSAEHSVDLISPEIDVTKTGPDTVKVGDEVIYTIGFTALSDGDALGECTGSDTVLGDLGVFVDGVTRDFPYTVQEGDPDPLLNVATITCAVEGFDNTASDSAEHSVDLIDPSVALTKECRPDPVLPGETIEWAITVDNTGDIDLDCLVNDPTAELTDEPVTVVAGGSETLNASRMVVIGDAPVISNTATVDCPIPGFDNTVNDEATADCEVLVTQEICRTPGFWGTHAGEEKEGRSTNLTQAVIDYNDGSLGTICGEEITNTSVWGYDEFGSYPGDGDGSAVEGICVHPKQEIVRQLARQLIAASLNCVVSGGGEDCAGISIYDDFTEANAACAANDGDLSYWIGVIDDFNNGVDSDCHERNLTESDVFADVDYKVPGPAGSSRACSAATKNDFYLVP